MKISTLLTEDSVFSKMPCTSKKNALELISQIAAKKLDVESQVLFNDLISREKIGSTGVGSGIAIPHVKISKDLPATAIFIQCETSLDYDSFDGNKVDILFAIFVPEDRCDEYLGTLAEISKKLLNKPFLRKLKNADSNQELFQLLQSE